MTKILVISDTHGDTTLAERVLNKNQDVDMVIHLGDYFRDADRLNNLFPNIRFEYVYGNSDFMIGNVPMEKVLEIEGQRILLTHGHRYSVKWGIEKLQDKAYNDNIQLLLFDIRISHRLLMVLVYNTKSRSISDPRGGMMSPMPLS